MLFILPVWNGSRTYLFLLLLLLKYDHINLFIFISLCNKVSHDLCLHAVAVSISSYGCTWEVWRALKKLVLLSAVPHATLSLLSCSPNSCANISVDRNTLSKTNSLSSHDALYNISLRHYRGRVSLKSLKLV